MKTKLFLANFFLNLLHGLHNKNTRYIIFILPFLFQNCTTAVNSLFENESLLNKKQNQISAHISKYRRLRISDYLRNEIGFDSTNIGLSYSCGVKSRRNIKARFEFLFHVDGLNNLKYISISPMFKIREENLSMIIPLENHFGNPIYLSSQSKYTKTIRKNKLSLTITPKFIMPLTPAVAEFSINPDIIVGMGFSNDFSKCAIRSEFGFFKLPNNLKIYHLNY